MSRAEENNRKMRKKANQEVAEMIQRNVKKKIIELNIPSHIPKDLNFLDSIQIKWVDYFTPIVGSPLIYYLNIEEGRQRGYHVPIQPLVKWCRYKLGMDMKQALKVAYAVERKIFNEGIRGRHPFRITLNEIQAGKVR